MNQEEVKQAYHLHNDHLASVETAGKKSSLRSQRLEEQLERSFQEIVKTTSHESIKRDGKGAQQQEPAAPTTLLVPPSASRIKFRGSPEPLAQSIPLQLLHPLVRKSPAVVSRTGMRKSRQQHEGQSPNK